MAIISAEIESSGWVLRLVVSGEAGSFGSYALDPDGARRLWVTSSHPGHVKSGGQAVPGALARQIAVTTPLRQPVNPADPNLQVIDETSLGGGQIRVRMALSSYIYPTDTLVRLNAVAGWRTGEAGALNVVVTNNSAEVAPMPIMRWAVLPFAVSASTFRLSLIVASHHPQGFEPVAGVRFTMTDGSASKSVWATALATDNSLDDNLRCYTVELDASTAPALAAGLLRCDAEVLPWLGSMRSTDPAGTRSMAALGTAATSTAAASPLVVGFDPAGTRYGQQWVMLDPVAGSTTASAAMVQPTLAAARAVASRARTIPVAMQALYLANRTLPAANGQPAATRSCDGARIVLPAGVTLVSGANVTNGLVTPQIPVRIIGDPEAANPRDNCIIRSTATQSPLLRVDKWQFENCTLELGQSRMFLTNSTTVQRVMFDRVTVQARPGYETAASANDDLFGVTAAAGNWTAAAVRTRWWRNGLDMNTQRLRFGLIRNCEHSRAAGGITMLKNQVIPDTVDGTFTASAFGGSYLSYGLAEDAGAQQDAFIAFNDARAIRGYFNLFQYMSVGADGNSQVAIRRHVMLGNVAERIGQGNQPLSQLGVGPSYTMTHNIVEMNTMIGDRFNGPYNDPSSSTTTNCPLILNRQAGNLFDRNPTKHDDFNSPLGLRPALIDGWSVLMGVMNEGNYDASRQNVEFPYFFRGLQSFQGNVAMAINVVDDRSILGTDAGGGDYRPTAASPFLNRISSGNTDRDLNNAVRSAGSPAGALEAAQAPGGVAIGPGSAAHGTGSSVAGLSVGLSLVPGGSRHGQRAGEPGLAAGTNLVPAGARMASAARPSALLLSMQLSPAPGQHLLGSGSPAFSLGSMTLVPANGSLPVTELGLVTIFPAAGVGGRRLPVGQDLRTNFARLG